MKMNLEQAIEIAVRAHKGQKDKSGQPYILHPLAVMLKCKTENEMIVAVLHDVVEDTEITSEALYVEGFSNEIICAIAAITKRPDEEYFDYIKRCKKDRLATIVKLHDLEHNMSDERQGRLPKEKSCSLMIRYNKAYRMLLKGD
jgi:(p)ppGpp synthase/HD superfamily hydrolase